MAGAVRLPGRGRCARAEDLHDRAGQAVCHQRDRVCLGEREPGRLHAPLGPGAGQRRDRQVANLQPAAAADLFQGRQGRADRARQGRGAAGPGRGVRVRRRRRSLLPRRGGEAEHSGPPGLRGGRRPARDASRRGALRVVGGPVSLNAGSRRVFRGTEGPRRARGGLPRDPVRDRLRHVLLPRRPAPARAEVASTSTSAIRLVAHP